MTDHQPLIDAVVELCGRGFPLVPCNGKSPIHDEWQHRDYSDQEIIERLNR